MTTGAEKAMFDFDSLELEEVFDWEEETETDPVFDVGTTTFPIPEEKDVIDPNAVLVNHIDSYFGKFLGQYLSSRGVGTAVLEGGEDDRAREEEDPTIQKWKVLGTFKDRKSLVPRFLWAMVKTESREAYLKELLKCRIVIYDITHDPTRERFEEIRHAIDTMRDNVEKFDTKRIFILVSSLHTWSHTVQAKDGEPLNESSYRRRRTKPSYREMQLLERYVIASGKMTKGFLKAYVIGAGAIYGAGEFPFHFWFKAAWHNAKYLPIFGSGKNKVPTIYINDLCSIIQNVMDLTPRKQRYIIAVDPVLCDQDQIVKAISENLGNAKVRRVGEEEIYLNREMTSFQSDQILLDLNIEAGYVNDNFNINWLAQDGLASIMKTIDEEFRIARNLTPLKIVIVGPPGVGKTTVCRQLSDIYHFHHFTLEEMVDSTREILRELSTEDTDNTIEGISLEGEKRVQEAAGVLLDQVEDIIERNEQLPTELIAKLFKFRLYTNPCQNQGFVLDGYPQTYEEAKALFARSKSTVKYPEYEGEYVGEDPVSAENASSILDLKKLILPHRVFVLEASDGFLVDRIDSNPQSVLEEKHRDLEGFVGSLNAWREKAQDYEISFLAFLDDIELIYMPINVEEDESGRMQETVARIVGFLGPHHHYGLTREEEDALRKARTCEKKSFDERREELEMLETAELEGKRRKIQEWMEKLSKVKAEEFEREEASLIPMRHYLMAHVVPTLARGLIDVTRARPDDPIDYLAEFLFQHNINGVNLTSNARHFL